MDNKEYLTPGKAAKLLHISPITLRYWANEGKLNFITTSGGHRRFKLSDIEQLQNTSNKQTIINGKPVILVVEDNDLHANLVVELVKELTSDYKVVVADDGYKAGSLIQKEKPQIILLDLMMPNLDGFSVCKQIKADNTTKNIPIIAMSGNTEPETIVKITKAGADAFLCKPLDIEKFNKTLENFISS